METLISSIRVKEKLTMPDEIYGVMSVKNGRNDDVYNLKE